jgi:hypothetical protein
LLPRGHAEVSDTDQCEFIVGPPARPKSAVNAYLDV